MSEEKKSNLFIENLSVLATPEGVQKYLLGTKKNGQSRAVYDVVKDFTKPKKKKKDKKSGGKSSSTYAFYLDSKNSKKKKKKKKDKYWHI